jgi:hypothetical protein
MARDSAIMTVRAKGKGSDIPLNLHIFSRHGLDS